MIKIKYLKLSLVIIMSAVLACQSSNPTNTNSITTMYERSNENFPNPERGFFVRFEPIGNQPFSPLELSKIQKVRSQNMTLIRRIYLLAEFRNKPLSSSFLKMVSNDCEIARKAGVKMIIRFSYNWQGGGQDAPVARILSHLEQLKPIFRANYDVISFLEAGFIGFWGEWNKSSNGLHKNPEARKAVLFKALSVLPSERMVALRYSHYKRDAFNNENPLSPKQAFKGTYRARTGAHNDCFLAGVDDWGTYNSVDLNEIDRQKTFLNLDNRYVVQSGELCNRSEYDDCPNALKELARMRWSALNFNSSDGVEIIKDWEKQGCLTEIKSRLGYRFRLLKSVTSSRVKPGGKFLLNFEVINDGWASPYNPRKLEVILRNRKNSREYFLPVKDDPRMWMPGTTNVVNITGGIPANMPKGEYEVLLNLPDPTPKLYNYPEYSIRLANKNIWEASTGYNFLLRKVFVNTNKGEDYSGKQFFKSR
ncbi:DUF4832 domain-containing protein [Iningainema sp. BLCCT55]|uniref:DUF4832 domain-containing protein n=2 Tax=Iningainema TaxID=1932705 RepID=A0A8J6XH54_9CYAN|nr:DUF4832 domain-containing protein [Iningainema tapete BLCC-T55]